MKKIYSIFSLLFMLVALNASADTNVYLKSTSLQVGAEGKIELCIETDNPIGTVNTIFEMPEGVNILDIQSAGAVTWNSKDQNLLLGKGEPYFSTGVVATLTVSVDADVELGDYPMTIKMGKLVEPNLTAYDFTDVESTLTVQKAAVIEELGDGNLVTIVPVAMKPGFYADGNVTALDIYYTSKTNLAGLSFNLNLPNSAFYSSAFDGDGNPVPAIVYNGVYNNASKTIGIETIDDQNLKVKYEGVKTTRAANQRYINSTGNDPVKLATIYIESEESLPEDIYTITLSDITLEEYVTAGTGTLHVGKNYSTIVVGKPEVTDPIIYGYMTPDAATEIAKTGDYSVVDMSPATIVDLSTYADICKAFEALVYHGGFSMYFRSLKDGKSYGTMCVPFDMESDDAATFYTLKSINENTMVFEPADKVPAGTPALFEGVLQCGVYEYVKLGTPGSVNAVGTVMKGTYETYDLAAGAGYYISNGKFYSDGAKVKPFRAYFDGVVSGVKSFSVQIETANGIIDITDKLSAEDIYSLQGIKMNKTQKGVNIVGGKKIYVK